MKLNINDMALVTLTPEGELQLRYEFRVWPNAAPKPEADGRYRMPLWDLFSTFGEACRMGSRPMFVNNEIEIEKQK